MIYALEDFDVDLPNDNRMDILDTFTNDLLNSKAISQHDVTELENKLRYNIFTKVIPLKSYTLVRSPTNVKETFYYIKEFKKEYLDVKDRINKNKNELSREIHDTIYKISRNLDDINSLYNKKYELDTLFANQLANRMRNKCDARFDDLVSSLTEYSKYCKSNGIKDTFFDASPVDIVIKIHKYDDLEICNILNQIEMDLYCIDIYQFLKAIIDNKELIDLYTNRMKKMISNLDSSTYFTFKDYTIVLDTLKLSINFTERIKNYYKDGESFINF